MSDGSQTQHRRDRALSFIAASGTGGADKGARHLNPGPATSDQPNLRILKQRHGLDVAGLVNETAGLAS